MKKDKLRIFAFEILLILILFFALFASNIITRGLLSIIISIYAIITVLLFKIRKVSSINKIPVTWMMVIFSMFYLGIFNMIIIGKYK